jgi:hypothetical protein
VANHLFREQHLYKKMHLTITILVFHCHHIMKIMFHCVQIMIVVFHFTLSKKVIINHLVYRLHARVTAVANHRVEVPAKSIEIKISEQASQG